MSKEREAFEKKMNEVAGRELDEEAFEDWYKLATAHYQPLLDAKDAEIARLDSNLAKEILNSMKLCEALNEEVQQNATLKALLEQAREAAVAYKELAQRNKMYGVRVPEHVLKKVEKAERTLTAINAATGKGE